MDTIEYFLNNINISVFNKSSQVKAKTFTDLFSVDHRPELKNTYLVIGKNIVSHGLQQLGFDVTIAAGIDKSFSVEDAVNTGKTWDYVIAPDEYFVNFQSEREQVDHIFKLCNLASKGLFTTLKDYKNMHVSQRFFQDPFEVKQDDGNSVIIRKRDWNSNDKQQWTQRDYIIKNNELIISDPVQCRTMYFKQLAKFSHDAGAKTFQVEKKQMYKPLFSKTFEYIVYISF